MDALQKVAEFGVWEEAYESVSVLGQLQAVYQSAQDMTQDFAAQVDGIRSDERFTADGVRQEIQKAAGKMVKDLDERQHVVMAAREKLTGMQQDLRAGLVSRDPVEEMKYQEIRRYLHNMPDDQRMGVIDQAVLEGQDDVLKAVITAPAMLKLVPFEGRCRDIEKQFLGKAQPALMAEIENYSVAVERASSALQAAYQYVEKLA